MAPVRLYTVRIRLRRHQYHQQTSSDIDVIFAAGWAGRFHGSRRRLDSAWWSTRAVSAGCQPGTLVKLTGRTKPLHAIPKAASTSCFGTSASYAPGPVRASDMIDNGIDLWFTTNGACVPTMRSATTRNSGRGVADTLDKLGSLMSSVLTDLNYHDADFAKDWEAERQTSYYEQGASTTVYPFPPGRLWWHLSGRHDRHRAKNAAPECLGLLAPAFNTTACGLVAGAVAEVRDITESKRTSTLSISRRGQCAVLLGGNGRFHQYCTVHETTSQGDDLFTDLRGTNGNSPTTGR